MAEFTAEQIEAADLSDFTEAQRVAVAATLYEIAPGTDSLEKRKWVANRLRVQLREVNRILWGIHGIRWPSRPLKRPAWPKPPAGPLDGSSTGLPDLDFTIDDLRL